MWHDLTDSIMNCRKVTTNDKQSENGSDNLYCILYNCVSFMLRVNYCVKSKRCGEPSVLLSYNFCVCQCFKTDVSHPKSCTSADISKSGKHFSSFNRCIDSPCFGKLNSMSVKVERDMASNKTRKTRHVKSHVNTVSLDVLRIRTNCVNRNQNGGSVVKSPVVRGEGIILVTWLLRVFFVKRNFPFSPAFLQWLRLWECPIQADSVYVVLMKFQLSLLKRCLKSLKYQSKCKTVNKRCSKVLTTSFKKYSQHFFI